MTYRMHLGVDTGKRYVCMRFTSVSDSLNEAIDLAREFMIEHGHALLQRVPNTEPVPVDLNEYRRGRQRAREDMTRALRA